MNAGLKLDSCDNIPISAILRAPCPCPECPPCPSPRRCPCASKPGPSTPAGKARSAHERAAARAAGAQLRAVAGREPGGVGAASGRAARQLPAAGRGRGEAGGGHGRSTMAGDPRRADPGRGAWPRSRRPAPAAAMAASSPTRATRPRSAPPSATTPPPAWRPSGRCGRSSPTARRSRTGWSTQPDAAGARVTAARARQSELHERIPSRHARTRAGQHRSRAEPGVPGLAVVARAADRGDAPPTQLSRQRRRRRRRDLAGLPAGGRGRAGARGRAAPGADADQVPPGAPPVRRRPAGPDREAPGLRRPGRLRGMVRPPAQAAAQPGEKPDRRGRGPGRAGHPRTTRPGSAAPISATTARRSRPTCSCPAPPATTSRARPGRAVETAAPETPAALRARVAAPARPLPAAPARRARPGRGDLRRPLAQLARLSAARSTSTCSASPSTPSPSTPRPCTGSTATSWPGRAARGADGRSPW